MASRNSSPNRSTRGLFVRLIAFLIGALVAGGLIIGMQVPLLHPSASTEVTLSSLRLSGNPEPIAWPAVGSAALIIPSLGVKRNWHDSVKPIASLTKLMTAYVVLKKLPLATTETGPCITITTEDVTTDELLKSSNQSSAAVTSGESICEVDLLEGLLVHSASNYADLLAQMVSGNVTSFVTLMNQTAHSLGLAGTHYADASGFSDLSVSTALDQGELAVLLMKSPLVRNIVDQTSVTLPFAGSVGSFTPYVGIDNVIGVKSGRTAVAGGCDVMAMTFTNGTATDVAYAVVLGQQGGDLLGPAGDAALALEQSATERLSTTLSRGTVVGHVGWGTSRARVVLGSSGHFSWWAAKGSLGASIHLAHFSSGIRKGQVVGFLNVGTAGRHRIALVADAAVAPPSLWQRLR